MENKQKETRTRRWCFTINNPTETAKDFVKGLERRWSVRYAVVGEEVAPSTETPHLQGYVEFESPATFKQMKARLEGAHLEESKGSAKQNRTYCTKGGKFYEVGNLTQRVQSADESVEVVSLIVLERVHPNEIAVHYPNLSVYIVNHYRALLDMWREATRGYGGIAKREEEECNEYGEVV